MEVSNDFSGGSARVSIFVFGFSSRKVPQRDLSIAAFVIVHAESYGGLQEKSF